MQVFSHGLEAHIDAGAALSVAGGGGGFAH
jgi:hypothetical protein